ncbi:PAS domain S-box protein [Alkalihalophilus sp. As8PL]|uniref:PAS domain S-box protein n=1 Tax=Alkalihalophilus sp. As8PL TaxID=3237103 RepID=A0AB39BX76_9BACI
MMQAFISTETDLYKEIVEGTFESTIVHSDYEVLYVNEAAAQLLGAEKEDLIGAPVLDIFPVDAKERIADRIERGLSEGIVGELIEQTIITLDDRLIEVELSCHPFIYNDKRAILSVLRNITSRKEIEWELQKRVNELSTPIVPVWDGISVIPLVGTIDFDRAKQLLNTLPIKIKSETDLTDIIIDFSGIYNMDELVVDFILKIDSIMRLLGVKPILTGIRPELAQKALVMGEGLQSIQTMSTVKKALAHFKSA